MANEKSFRLGDLPGMDYLCSKCKARGLRLWRQSHTFLNHIELMCAECAEADQTEQIARYASFHQVWEPGIGDLIPARPTPEGDTFWGHTSGDVEWWYKLPQYKDEKRELQRVRIELDHFVGREQQALKDWLEARRDLGDARELLRQINEQVGNQEPNHRRHALTPELRDRMRDLLAKR